MRLILAILTLVGVLFLAVAFPQFLAPGYKATFADFGGELPTLTRLALKRWFGPAAATPSLLLLGAALLDPPASPRVTRYLVMAFLLVAAGVGVTLAAMYLPVLQATENLRAA
jgi:type II secretory pathway component PulF